MISGKSSGTWARPLAQPWPWARASWTHFLLRFRCRRCPHHGDVAQQEVEVVAAPVVKAFRFLRVGVRHFSEPTDPRSAKPQLGSVRLAQTRGGFGCKLGEGPWQTPLGSRVLEYQQTSTRSSSDLPRIVPSHKPAWVRVADPAAEHTRLSAASKAEIEWLLQCFQADLACPLRSKPILARKAAAGLCRGHHSRHRWLVYLQPLRLLVCRNVGLPRSPAAVAVPHKGGSALHSVLRNPGPTGANAPRLDSRGTSSARLMRAFQHG